MISGAKDTSFVAVTTVPLIKVSLFQSVLIERFHCISITHTHTPMQTLPTLIHAPQGEFTDEGTETHFTVASHSTFIKAVSSGNKRKGLTYTLALDGSELEPVKDIAAIEQ